MPDLHPSATHFKAVSPPLSAGHEPLDSRSDVCNSSRSMLFPTRETKLFEGDGGDDRDLGRKIVYADMDEVMRI